MIKNPKQFFLRLFSLGVLYFTLMIKISEMPVHRALSPHRWTQCIWHTFITMITVGYGDTTPTTYWGRFFSILCGIFGYTFFSLFIITLNKILKMNKIENTVYSIIGKNNQNPKILRRNSKSWPGRLFCIFGWLMCISGIRTKSTLMSGKSWNLLLFNSKSWNGYIWKRSIYMIKRGFI